MLCWGGKTIEVWPAVHRVPAVGGEVHKPRGYWVVTGDTEAITWHQPHWRQS